MKEAIETRELFTLDNLGVVLQGTCHDTCDKGLGAQSNLIKRDRVGLLFMNGLSAMRSAKGDSAVYWADSFAKRGYPSFRLDLPDSETPKEIPQQISWVLLTRGDTERLPQMR